MKFVDGEDVVTNDTAIIGFGKIELEENDKSQMAIFDMELLQRTLDIAKKMKWEKVFVRIQDNFPIFLTDKKEHKIGILLAPKQEED